MEIYLLRHGMAEQGIAGGSDSQRALTEEGRRALRDVLRRAHRADVNPSLILSSPYRRAVETAREAAEALGYRSPVEQTKALLPDAPPQDVWDEIRQRQGESAVLLVGHEPMMSSLASFLMGCPSLSLDFKKAALVRIDCGRLSAQPAGTLKWMLVPAVCRD